MDINTSYPFLLAGKARTKSRVRVKKRTGEKSINCKDL